MKRVYQVGAAHVRVLLNYDGSSGAEGTHYVSRVYCRPGHRRNGYARAAFEECCLDADRELATLTLDVEPDADTGIARLTEFYRSMGFRHVDGTLYERRPDPSRAAEHDLINSPDYEQENEHG